MKQRVCLGVNHCEEVVFADFKHDLRRNYFVASFDMVYPTVVTDDYLLERAEDWIDNIDGEIRWELCERYDCKPSELANEYLAECGVSGVIDTSLFSESFQVDGVEGDIYFESSSCGQSDPRLYGGMKTLFVSEDFFNTLMFLWDHYHLGEMDDIGIENYNKLMDEYEQLEYREYESTNKVIQSYLEELYTGECRRYG